ncbi:MAG TPA: IucA/IucC family protein [Methylophilaceae bacterium]|nr:IucA/IucC family protein [Methylophilaceae bacterium]
MNAKFDLPSLVQGEALNQAAAVLEAEQRSQQTLLNCYCREVAAPNNELTVGPLFSQNEWPMSIKLRLQHKGGQAMEILLPHTQGRLLTVVAFYSATGNFRYRAPVFHKAQNKPWCMLEGGQLASLLLRELSQKYALSPNTELMEQIRDSVAMTTLALSLPVHEQLPEDPVQAYIDSEQSLTFGHPFHPAPKSRQGFSPDSLARYSPEMRTRFALHYFAIREEDVRQQSLMATSCTEAVSKTSPPVEPGFIAMPTHPWQAEYLLGLPLVKQALGTGRMRYLGAQGEDFYPTSSIRTLYQPGNPFFYKFSLNVRITNCVRKNAWYELESAMAVTRILRPLLPQLYDSFDGMRVLEEPAFMSVDLGDADGEANKQVVEGFGMILRQSFDTLLQPDTKPVLAGALFGNHVYSEKRLRRLVENIAARETIPPETAIEQWFAKYLKLVLHPVLHCYFAHGLIFEPHLQNVVIGIQHDWPRQVFLRDFEGVKLVSERYHADQLQGISQRAQESLWYSSEQGWNRIAYCLFVNNFCEAISQLAPEQPALQQRLWQLVRHSLQEYQALHGDTVSVRRLNALLNGQPFPAKTNMINRFFKRPDREAAYVPVINPIAMTGGGSVAWN